MTGTVNGDDGSRPWVIVQHVAHEGPGLIAEALDVAGVTFEVRRMDLGHRLPAVAAIGGLVVLGGPMGVDDQTDHPWLSRERTVLAEAVQTGLPVLGVCLGAQQLAVALGAEVGAASEPEVGVGSVVLTGAGRRDPVFGPECGGMSEVAIPCMHWHRDTFTLPDGAEHLAATRVVPHQAMRIGRVAYGLQFHVEVNAELAAAWSAFLPRGTGIDQVASTRIEMVGRRLLGRFVRLAQSIRMDDSRAWDGPR